MASISITSESEIIEIEDDIIDLDEADKTPEEVIYDWDAKIRKKLSNFAVADNENVLGGLMKEYLQSLDDMFRSYEDNETLKNKVFCHISFLYSYFVELQCCTTDNYLIIMEDILTLYCNLVLGVLRPLKKKDFSEHKYKKRIVCAAKRLISVLTVYLLQRHDHILHVLIKMNTHKVLESGAEVLKILYRHFLTKVPAFDLCDESFCRSYIVFQKWKQIQNVEDREGMDKCMYKMFKRTPESIKDSETLRRILLPLCSSTVDVVRSLFRSHHGITSAYFDHMAAKTNIEIDDLDFNIDLGEDEPTTPVNNDAEEDVQFQKTFYEIERNMSNVSHVNNTSDIPEIDIFRKFKVEMDEDDDVQFVGITMLQRPPILDLISDKDTIWNNNETSSLSMETDRMRVLPSPPLLNPTINKSPDLENLNGVTRIRIGTPRTVSESSASCQSSEMTEPLIPIVPVEDATTQVEVATTHVEDATTQVEVATTQVEVATTHVEDATTQVEVATTQVEVATTHVEVVPETNLPKVSFASHNTPPADVLSPTKATEVNEESNVHKRTVEMKSVETQVNEIKNYSHDDYGVTTPPFEMHGDELSTRSVEPQDFTSTENAKKNLPLEKEQRVVSTQTVEVQVDSLISQKICPYNDYGLTPPNDTHLEDNTARLQEPLYTDLGHKGVSHRKVEDIFEAPQPQVSTHTNEIPPADDVAQEDFESETDKNYELIPNLPDSTVKDSAVIEPEFEEQSDISEMANIDMDEDTEEIDVESCQDTDYTPFVHEENCEPEVSTAVELTLPKDSNQFRRTDQIDTGQKTIQNSAPNIPPVTAEAEVKETLEEIYNGNIVLKPLTSSNRTNGQAKESATAKVIYTSTSKKLNPTLDDFSRFENALHNQWNRAKENHDFDDILSGPVSKAVPVKPNSLFTCQEKMDLFGQESNSKGVVCANSNSRSNSPNESPPFEGIEDFRNYFSNSVNGRVPAPHDIKIPSGILKKGSRTRRKDARITFHESTYDNSERRTRRHGVLMPKQIERDVQLNMVPSVVLERMSFIEEKVKFEKCFVKYDKSNNGLCDKDERRSMPDHKLTWIIKSSSGTRNPASLTVDSRELPEKKPKKRKFELPANSLSEPVKRKRGRPRKNL